MPSVHKTVKHTLKILQQILQDFERVFRHFLESRHIIGLTLPNPFDSRSSQNYFHWKDFTTLQYAWKLYIL